MMKRSITFIISAFMLMMTSLVWGQTREEAIAYTLDGTITGGTNGYAVESEITQNGITWMVTANTDINPWRVGGKNLNEVDRPMYSTNQITDNITKFVVTNGDATITVNSMTLIVSDYADFSNPTSIVSGTWVASSTTTFEKPADVEWINKYYKLVYNVTNTTSSNKYAKFVKAELFKEGNTSSPSISADNVEILYSTTSGAIEYTINNPIAGGVVTATTTSDWIILGMTDSTIPFTCEVNEGIERTATITITYTYNGDQTVSKNVLVTQEGNPNGPGTENNPYTVAQAHEAIDAGTGTQGVYATGIVSAIPTAYSTQYSNITFNLVDNEGDEVFLQAYRCGGDEASSVQVGDIAIVYGNLTKYGSTYEFGQGCQLVSLTHPAVTIEAPTFAPQAGTYETAQTVTISCETSGANIYYTSDGSDPTNESTQYNGPFTVSQTTTIKAIAYIGEEASSIAKATYHINSENNPYTVAQALAFNEYPTNSIYVHGIVSTAPTYLISGGYLTYNISDNGETDTQLQVYKGKGLNNEAFTSVDDIQLGDIVTIYGNVVVYNNTLEFASGNYLVSIEHPQILNPTLNVSPEQLEGFSYTYNAGPSTSMSFSISGSDLQENVSIAATQDFEVSTESDGTYSNTLSLTPTDGTIDSTVYVRMKAGLSIGNHTGNVTITTGELSSTINLSGIVNEQPTTETPTFTPISGSYLTGQNITISTTTADATIYYTLDGTDPDESSVEYSEPIAVNASMVIKAIATAPGFANSAIASATFTIVEPMTIAEARALQANEYGCVEGIVTFIDNRNVYVQDETAGIVLYLDNNTVPTALELGDKVRAYGKRGAYNGLVELTGIDGTDDLSEFLVLTSGNELPLALKTIAEINEDYSGSNLLQSTRVQIVHAIIGTINPSGNTPLTQDDNTINIYRIPTVEGLIAGDWVTLTGIIGCYNAPQLRIVNAEDVEYTHRPTLSASTTSLSGMTYDVENGGPSEIVSFELSGSYLSDAVYVYPSENFEVSTMGGDLFSAEDPTAVYSSGEFSGVNIYVRMKSNLEVGTYTEQLYAVSENADTLFINVEGIVNDSTPTPPDPPTPPTPPTDGNYVRIANLDSLTVGSLVIFAARFDENANDYYAMSNTSSGKPTGVLFTSAIAGEEEVLPASIVDEESSYYWTVGATANGYTFTNALGEMIGYSTGTNFATGGDNTEWAITFETAGETTMVPNYEGFVITNVNNSGRAFALNNSHNFGPYAKSNMTSGQAGNYNFFLDLFVKAEGGNPPTPPTPPTPIVATPVFSLAGGTYYEPQEVVITCATEDAIIYYTLDGSEPDTTSSVYSSEPLLIQETTILQAIAMKEGYDNSAIASAEYTIQLGFVTIFNQDWEGEWNGWTEVNVVGDSLWRIATYQGNHYAFANGYNHPATIDWLISPVFNLNAYSNPMLSFRTAKNYQGSDIEVFFSSDYDGNNPEDATWDTLQYQLSTGGYTWVDSETIDLSTFSGDSCYIGFKYTCEEGSAAAWEVDDILLLGQTSEPVVTVTPLTLTDFTYIEGNGPSSEQSFTVSGLNLSDDIVITAATNFEISRYSGDGFDAESPITLPLVGGNIEETPIYVRLKAELTVGEYNEENILITCADVDTIVVTCSGSVTEQPEPADDYIRISDVSALVAGNRVILAARYNETSDAYRAIANTLTSGKLSTTEFTSLMDGENEILPADIMSNEDNYYWTVGVTADGYTFTNANGNMIGYGNSGTNFVMDGAKTVWTVTDGISDTASLVPEYYGFNIINFTTNTRAFGLRYYNEGYTCGAYSTSNFNNANAGEYNYFFDIFMQGEGGVPPTPTVATPTFTPDGGTYYEPQEVIINCGTEGATIYYSTSEEGPWEIYTGPIAIDSSMTICFYATMEGYNDSPVVCEEYIIQDDLVIIFNQDWEDDWNGWTEVLITGDSLWHIAAHSGNHYAYANGYNHPATIDWLISPVFNLDNYNDVRLSFLTARNYEGPTLEVYFTNNFDIENFASIEWFQLDCDLSDGAWNWIESGEISLDDYSGQECRIGFRYESLEGNVAAAWEVDDIMLYSGSVSTNPYLNASPNELSGFSHLHNQGPSEPQYFILSGGNFLPLTDEDYGSVALTLDGDGFEMSFDSVDNYSDTLYIDLDEGMLLDTLVFVRLSGGEIGEYTGTITIVEPSGVNVLVTLYGSVLNENQPMMDVVMPYFIQGNNGSNNNRVPMAAPVEFVNLEPNSTYRYTNQFVDDNDGSEIAGAGNVIYANPEGFYRSTSPSLATEGGYGEFTTDEEGHAIVWLMNEPTANTRFTPGNHVYIRCRLNDGNEGTAVEHIFTSEDYATVINFGTENDEYSGSAFYVKSNENPGNFALLYSNSNDRPVYCTSIETTGVDYSAINQYADFYKELVAGNDGWFGGILPNVNELGIKFILTIDMNMTDHQIYNTNNGHWYPDANTVNPNAGLDDPIFIDLTEDGVEESIATNVKVWNTDHEFIVENGDDARYTMRVVNVLGQTVMSQEIAAGCTERISHNLSKGLYVVSLRNNRNSVAVKVIVR